MLKEESFTEQVELMRRFTEKLKGRWTIQKFKFGCWEGLDVNPTIPENPLTERWPPFSGKLSYESSAEAVEDMLRLQSIDPATPMRVSPVEEDINRTQMAPRMGDEKLKYGQYPSWGELLRKFPEFRPQNSEACDVRVQRHSTLARLTR